MPVQVDVCDTVSEEEIELSSVDSTIRYVQSIN